MIISGFELVLAQNSEIIFNNGRIVNDFSQSIQNTETNMRVVIQAEITNGKSITQPYVYIITVKDQNGGIIWDTQTNSGVHAGKTKLLESSWVPEIPGLFNITLELIENLENKKILGDSLSLSLLVEGDPVLTPLEELQLENEGLKKQILEIKLELRELKKSIDNLNQIIMEQINVIYTWILGQ